MKARQLTAALLALALGAEGAMAATTLSRNERARVARASPGDRSDVRACLIERKRGQKKGTVIGAAGGGGTTAIGGGNVGESLLGAGIGAIAGNLVGKEAATSKRCHRVLERNR